MAFVATLQFEWWKQHTCVYCGERYRYLLKKTQKGQGQNQDQARQALEFAILEVVKKEVTSVACPACGHFQPDMIRSRRLVLCGVLLALAILVLLLELLFPLIGTIGDRITIYVLGSLASAIALVAILFGLSNANRNTENNLVKSQQEMAEGRVQFGPPAEFRPPPPAFQGKLRNLPLCLVLLLGAMLPFTAELNRIARGWPENPSWSPQVVGPGDYTWIRFSGSSLQSVKGNWMANSLSATVLNAKELGLTAQPLKAISSQSSWGQSISVKSGEKSQSFSPWCGIYVPNDPQLAGKTLRIKMDMVISYPAMRGANGYENMSSAVTHTAEIVLSPPSSGACYRALWGISSGLGLAFILAALIAALVRINNLKTLSLPTEVFPATAVGSRERQLSGEV